jgi:hypothetical protein
MNRNEIRAALTKGAVYFEEDWFTSNGFAGVRFTFSKKELKKVDKIFPHPNTLIKAYFKQWCIEAF